MTGRAVETARSLVERLLGHGVTDAVLAPGSRSGPLALALHAADRQGLIRLHVRVDEREAAFLALGLAKTRHRIVPVVTTSGTAAANLHPALLEAAHTGIPVLAVTADRPGRLRGTGANQTTDQRELFAGVPYVESVDAIGRRDGPQQLNLELDEPLIEPIDWDFPAAGMPEDPEPNTEPLPLTSDALTVVIAGDASGIRAREVAEAAGWPVLAEPTSGSRGGDHALLAGRLLLQHASVAQRIERVVSFGHSTLTRPVTALLARSGIEIVHVGDQATFPVAAGDNVRFADDVIVTGACDPDWLTTWQDADRAASAAIGTVLDGSTPYDVARTIHAAVPPGGLLVVGSSNPIRDLDLVAGTSGGDRVVIGNRGLAGIDGMLSTAIGAALGRQTGRAIAYVGDLTFLHGSNGLLIGPSEPQPDLTIVVVNDDGGSIFSTLEQGAAEYVEPFERVYATPTGADLGALCTGFGVPHRRVGPADLAAALDVRPTGIEVVEVPVERADRRVLAERLSQAVRSALD